MTLTKTSRRSSSNVSVAIYDGPLQAPKRNCNAGKNQEVTTTKSKQISSPHKISSSRNEKHPLSTNLVSNFCGTLPGLLITSHLRVFIVAHSLSFVRFYLSFIRQRLPEQKSFDFHHEISPGRHFSTQHLSTLIRRANRTLRASKQ